MWLTAANLTSKRFIYLDRLSVDWTLIALPWICWFAYIITNVVIGLREPFTVVSNGWYCFTRHQLIFDAHHYTNAAFAVLLVLFELALARVVWILYRKRVQLRRQVADATASQSAEQLSSSLYATWAGFGMPFAFRTLVFGTYTLVLVAVSIWLLFDDSSKASSMPDVLNASVAPAAGLVFCTQGDVITVWRTIPDRTWSWWRSRRMIAARRRASAASGKSQTTQTVDTELSADTNINNKMMMLSTPPKTPMEDRTDFLMSFEDFLGVEATDTLDYDAPRPSLFSLGRRSTGADLGYGMPSPGSPRAPTPSPKL